MSLYSVKFYFEEYRSEIRKTNVTTLSKALGLFKEQIIMYKNKGLKPYKAEILKDGKIHLEISLEISPKEKLKIQRATINSGESNVNSKGTLLDKNTGGV